MNCPFCDPKVIKEESLFENETTYVIYNIRPANKGQCFVVPKRHLTNIRDFNKNELIDLITAVQHVSLKYNEYLKPEGFNYGFNESQYSGQTIEHFHFHIIPRIKGDKDKLPEYHLFHRNPKTKQNLTPKEMKPFIDEMRSLLH